MVSENVRRLVLVVVVMILVSDGSRLNTDTAGDVLAPRQRHRTMLVDSG